jgi:protein TilB
VTEAMIRSRAEHNDGILGTLEELSMHMLHIEKIEYFDKLCKKLKILLLQNNVVSKIGKIIFPTEHILLNLKIILFILKQKMSVA